MTVTLSPALEDRLIAAVDLVGRSGATDLDFGHLDDTANTADARWWAKATYRGAVIMVDEQADPVDAVELLAVKILAGGGCAWCGNLIVLNHPVGDAALDAVADLGMIDRVLDVCRWSRTGRRWDRGCSATTRAIDVTDREQVVAAGRAMQARTRQRFDETLARMPRRERRRLILEQRRRLKRRRQ